MTEDVASLWRSSSTLNFIIFHHLSSFFISSSTYQCLNFRRVETSQILGPTCPTCPTCPTSLSVPSSTWVVPSSRSSRRHLVIWSSPGDFQLRREPSRRHTNGSDMNSTTSRREVREVREVRKGLVRLWWERWESRSSKLVPIIRSNGCQWLQHQDYHDCDCDFSENPSLCELFLSLRFCRYLQAIRTFLTV